MPVWTISAGVHDPDPGGQGHRLFLVMGHDHEGDAELVLDVHELELRRLAELLVQGAQRLVEQQQLGLLDQAAGERDPLALAARELMGLALAVAVELDHVEHVLDPLGDLPARVPSWRSPKPTFCSTVICGKRA